MTRSTSDDSVRAGPPWQRNPSISTDENGESKERPGRKDVIERARRFLEQDEVRNAPPDRQIAFLESKGLRKDEIQELLSTSRIQDTRESEPEPASGSTLQATTVSVPVPNSQPPRDVPPIITYPEFLTTSARPAPVVTSKRLLAVMYMFGALSMLLYGTRNYLVTPMIERLTASRHTLAETAQANLDKLIAKLKTAVSEKSPTISTKTLEYSDDEESDTDPTELFHRDIGVQTSSFTSPSISRPSTPLSALDHQTAGLSRLTAQLSSLTEASISQGQGTADLTIAIGLLRNYLNSLPLAPTTAGNYGARQAANDEIAKVKATIRSLKGVLLSTRTFPPGTSAAVSIGKLR